MSPERIAPEKFGFKNGRPTIASDCYALGMVIYETISGNVPFHKDTDVAVFMKVVVEGEHPPRGAKFATGLWGMLERCWVSEPENRPSIGDVLRCLEMVSNLSEPASSGADGGVDEDGNSDSTTSSSRGDSPNFFATDDSAQFPPIHSLQDDYSNRPAEQKGESPEATSVPYDGQLPPPYHSPGQDTGVHSYQTHILGPGWYPPTSAQGQRVWVRRSP